MNHATDQAQPQLSTSALVARFAEALAGSLEPRATARRLAELMAVHVADMCVVDVLDEQGAVGHMAVAATDPAIAREFEALRRRSPLNLRGDHPAARVLRRGRAELLPEMDLEMLSRFAQDEDHASFVERIGYRSAIIVPLEARGRRLGAMSLLRFDGTRPFNYPDMVVVDQLGRHAALALDNARLHSKLRGVVSTLGSAFVPDRFEQPPGIEVLGRYQATGELNEVGGDFYDVFECGARGAASSWAVVIGDVRGKGPEAARVTALARYALRSAATGAAGPAEMLRALNRTFLSQPGEPELCTVCLATLDIDGSRARVTVALAGHPRPLLARADGGVIEVGEHGGMLGASDEIRVAERSFDLEPGDTLLLYTDGVVDAGAPRSPFGEDGLMAVVRDTAAQPLGLMLSAIIGQALRHGEGELRDDIALLAVRPRAAAL